jgi:hypothetical protein
MLLPAAVHRNGGSLVKVLDGLDLANQQLKNLADGSLATDAVTLQQLQAYVRGLDWKESVRAASTANVNVAAARRQHRRRHPGRQRPGAAEEPDDRQRRTASGPVQRRGRRHDPHRRTPAPRTASRP